MADIDDASFAPRGLTRLARAIKNQRTSQAIPNAVRRQGVIVTYNSGTTPKTVDITLGGSATTIPAVRFIDSAAAWTPVAADVVEVLVFGQDMIVLGKLRP